VGDGCRKIRRGSCDPSRPQHQEATHGEGAAARRLGRGARRGRGRAARPGGAPTTTGATTRPPSGCPGATTRARAAATARAAAGATAGSAAGGPGAPDSDRAAPSPTALQSSTIRESDQAGTTGSMDPAASGAIRFPDVRRQPSAEPGRGARLAGS
jgi:hypothetical protein